MNSPAFAAAIAASMGPTPERSRHDRVTRTEETIADAYGLIGRPWRVDTLLDRLERRGDIDRAQHAAGDEFGRLFHLAALDPLKAAALNRTAGRDRNIDPNGIDRARRRVHAALDALGGQGSPCGSCAWFVLGCELSLHQWALREGWGKRPISPHVAKGTLLGTLGVLAGHFGL